MKLFIFARFHSQPGNEAAVEQAVRDVIAPSRAEDGCLSIHAFRSTRDSRLFYIHSCWISDDAFELHAGLPHTVRFIEGIEPLIDQPLEITRTTSIG